MAKKRRPSGLRLALYYLERRPRTEYELRKKLTDKEVPPDEVEAVMEKLKQLGYIDDKKYAENFQRARNDYKPMGVRRIRLELQLKGIPKEIIGSVQAEKETEYNLALAAAQTRLRLYRQLEPLVFERRMMGFLSRRGFSFDAIKQVLAQLKQESEYDKEQDSNE